jgi:hypothetical protein
MPTAVNAPVFSILIPSVPRRRLAALALYDNLEYQARGLDVEILLLLDNHMRSIGKKREALVQASRGRYVAFVDDDDGVDDYYVREIVEAATFDSATVITFDSHCIINDGPVVRVNHSLANPNEEYNPAGFKRKPWHVNAWAGDLARAWPFPDTNYGEDWAWCESMLPFVRTEHHIDAVLYFYRYDSKVTEAHV